MCSELSAAIKVFLLVTAKKMRSTFQTTNFYKPLTYISFKNYKIFSVKSVDFNQYGTLISNFVVVSSRSVVVITSA